jgi:uncharacterized protein (TIGR03086 family)
MFDLGPATRQLTRLVRGVHDDQLTAPTPCPDYTLGDLLEHVHGLALAFTLAARKEQLPEVDTAPSGDASRLPQDWRTAIATRLADLAAAWQDEAAWQGMTSVAGVTMPAADMAAVAVDEVVVHGWDVARSSGQDFEVDEASLAVASAFVGAVSGPDQADMRSGIFGPVVAVAEDASPLDRLIGDTGRDPHWRSPETADLGR